MDLLSYIVILHLVGTVLGVGGATFVEININRSLKDGVIDPIEGGFLSVNFRPVRIGLIISVVTGVAFLLIYRFEGQAFRIYDPVLCAKLTMIGVIVFNALLLQVHKLPLWLGIALSFVSCYAAMVAGIMLRGPAVPYLTVMSIYLVGIVIGVFALMWVRRLMGVKGTF